MKNSEPLTWSDLPTGPYRSTKRGSFIDIVDHDGFLIARIANRRGYKYQQCKAMAELVVRSLGLLEASNAFLDENVQNRHSVDIEILFEQAVGPFREPIPDLFDSIEPD